MTVRRILSVVAVLSLAACADSITEPKPPQAPAVTRQIAAPTTADNNIHDVINTVIDAIKACRDDGWKTYTTTSGHKFKNELECILYASLGGTLVPIAPPPPPPTPPVIASFTRDGLGDCDGVHGIDLLFTATFSGGTGVVTVPGGGSISVSSGVQFRGGLADGNYTLTVTGPGGSVSSVITVTDDFSNLGCSAPAIRIAPSKPIHP